MRFSFSFSSRRAADHPSPGGRHPGDAQLPGLRLPGDHGRLQHGRALPFTVVSRGTSKPPVRRRGGEGCWESTTRPSQGCPCAQHSSFSAAEGRVEVALGRDVDVLHGPPAASVRLRSGWAARRQSLRKALFFFSFSEAAAAPSLREALPRLPKAEDRHEAVSGVGFCKGFLSVSAAWRGLGAAAAEFCWRGCHQRVCGAVCPQVHAARCGGRLHAEEPQLPQSGGSLLLVLCLLQQVCRWPCRGDIDAEFTVSPKHCLPPFVSPAQALSTAVF